MLLKVVSMQSLSCGGTTEFGDGLFLLSPEFWCFTSISGCEEQTVS